MSTPPHISQKITIPSEISTGRIRYECFSFSDICGHPGKLGVVGFLVMRSVNITYVPIHWLYLCRICVSIFITLSLIHRGLGRLILHNFSGEISGLLLYFQRNFMISYGIVITLEYRLYNFLISWICFCSLHKFPRQNRFENRYCKS